MSQRSIYLASPLGFALSTRPFMDDIVARLRQVITVINPWDDQRFDLEFEQLRLEDSVAVRDRRLAAINQELGRSNAANIETADGLFAILDGVDVDSGTAAEIGYAAALGKRVNGLRTDFRLAGDNAGAIVNLQVQYFIERTGGTIVTSADAFVNLAKAFAGEGARPPDR